MRARVRALPSNAFALLAIGLVAVASGIVTFGMWDTGDAVVVFFVLLLGGLAVFSDYRYAREQARLHRELNERNAALERSNAALAEFAYVASHDVQEPLRTVASFSQLLQRRYADKLGNALKYFAAAPRIALEATAGAQMWTVAVGDNGIGISAEYHDRIFRIFQRLHTRTEYSGTGIGLAIAKGIVDRHGGRIWVESEEGNGSTFYFTLRRADSIEGEAE